MSYMKADLTLLKELTSGAAVVTQEEDGFHFYRMTESQIRAYDDRKEDLQYKVYAASGIRLEFKTDCRTVSFTTFLEKGSTRESAYFDVAVNGVLTDHTGVESCVKTPVFSHTIHLDGKVNTVTIYFPCLTKVTLRDLSLEGGTFSEAVKRPHTLLSFGDSITHGYDAEYPSMAYPNILGDELEANVFNKAVGGDIFRPGVIDEGENIKPDWITVAYGTNDWSCCTRECLQGNAEIFFEKLCRTYPGVKIYAIVPIWRKDADKATPCGPFEEARQLIASIANRHQQITVIDGMELVPHQESFYCDGYLHPNAMGFLCMAKNLLHYIKKKYDKIKGISQ